jgi:hypothetical protein
MLFKNVGKTDAIIRVVAALVIFALGVYYESWWGLVGIIPLATAVVGYCPLWHAIKVNTRGGEKTGEAG